MKKLVYLWMMGMALGLVSCSTDSNASAEQNAEKITGTWNLSAFEVQNGKADLIVNGQSTTGDFTAVGNTFDATLTFGQSPNTVEYAGSYEMSLTYTLLGQEVTQNVPGENLITNGTWEIVGDSLMTTDAGVTTKFFIKELTNSSLKLESDFARTQTVPNYGNVYLTGLLNVEMTK